jgi:hypothetical protein
MPIPSSSLLTIVELVMNVFPPESPGLIPRREPEIVTPMIESTPFPPKLIAVIESCNVKFRIDTLSAKMLKIEVPGPSPSSPPPSPPPSITVGVDGSPRIDTSTWTDNELVSA